MTFEKLATIVAKDFRNTMAEEGFATFNEMVQCYWWDSSDIKEEVDSILRDASNGSAYVDEADGSCVLNGDDMMSYRTFTKMWRKLLNSSETEE